MSVLMVPREPVAALIERLVAERDDDVLVPGRENGGGLSQLATELAAAGSMSEAAWQRRLYAIRTGEWVDKKGRRKVQAEVTFDVVDRMLAALDLTHLWFGELAEYLPPVPGSAPVRREIDYPASIGRCPRCERKLDPAFEPAGTVERFGHCALCVAKLTRNRLRRGKWTFPLLLALYERYLLTGESHVHLLRAHGVPTTDANASQLNYRWRELGWPRRTIAQSRRLGEKLHPKPVVVPKVLRDYAPEDPEKFIRQLHALHWHRRVSINALAKEFAPKLGASQSRLSSAISVAFSKLGLPAHARIAMTVKASTKNGLSPRDRRKRSQARKAAGLTVHGAKPRQPLCGEFGHTVKNAGRNHGKPCPRAVVKGKTFCVAHAPDRQERVAAMLAQMRAVSHDPSKFEPLAPLQAELLEAAAEVGWARLDRLNGTSKGYLSKLARGTTAHGKSGRIGKKLARRIRVVIARAKADALIERVRELREAA